MLDMPSAHMAPDGQLALTVADLDKMQRYTLEFQALPWMETSFSFAHIGGWDGLKEFYDRRFGVKARLVQEDGYFPDVSVGIRDILGTGVYSSEFLAASKHAGSLDFTVGLGWGRLAGNGTFPNPFGEIFKSFDTRKSFGSSGLVDFGQFFHGPRTGVFGGAIWQTPIDGLRLLAEYSSDTYEREAQIPHGIKILSPVNVGLSYQPYDAIALSAGWFYGSTYGLTVSLNGDPKLEASSAQRVGPPVPPAIVRDNAQQKMALSAMLDRNSHVAAVRAGGPWVHVPSEAERAKQDLTQALLSESRGVRGIDIQGTTVVIDAHQQANAQAQCAQYAQVALVEDTARHPLPCPICKAATG